MNRQAKSTNGPVTRGKREDAHVCIHESAHVVAAWRLPLTDMPHYVTVIPDYKRMLAGGMTDFSHIATREEVKATIKRGSTTRTRKELLAFMRKIGENKAMVSLAGPAADKKTGWDIMDGSGEYYDDLYVCFEKRNRVKDDESWRELLQEILGFDGEKGDWGKAWRFLSAFENDERRREEWLLRLWCRSIRFIGKHWKEVDRFALFLQERRTLDREGIIEAFELIDAEKAEA